MQMQRYHCLTAAMLWRKEGLWPGLEYPRIPGHEIAGIIEEMGSGVDGWTGLTGWRGVAWRTLWPL
jgi:D-arabinose 1-dehydrogenase-like Zn-dependent alcohol dehydrogenase